MTGCLGLRISMVRANSSCQTRPAYSQDADTERAAFSRLLQVNHSVASHYT